ncbi:glycosyltransferase family 2 protein [Lysinibacillus yapensis]|uniref:glycosyltransferase family 2 protein n=1 Tax=Ureibacillus yapensis TaxID=2304605 RepID=UPI001314E343|nr:glycosyltransferase family 2 protein [Lysinibacillus yapensis]
MTVKKPLISVIIPTFNRGNIILDTIQSVLNQTYTNFELLIVDDASTDHTSEMVNSISDQRIKYIKLNQNTKGKEARNKGITESTGEFIAFLDSDDLWAREKLEKQLKFMIKNANNINHAFCFTNLYMQKDTKLVNCTNKLFSPSKNVMDYILSEKNIVQTSTYMVSSNLAKRTLFNNTLTKHQDWDFCLRLLKNQAEFLFYPESLTIWKVDDRKDRISAGYKNIDVSLKWLEENRPFLSKKAICGFEMTILYGYYLRQKEFKKALKILKTAKNNQALNLYDLIKSILLFILFKLKIKNS